MGHADIALELVGGDVRLSIGIDADDGPGAARLIVSLPMELVGLLEPTADAFAPLIAAITGDDDVVTAKSDTGSPAPSWGGLAYDASVEAAPALVQRRSADDGSLTHLLTALDLDHARPARASERALRVAALARQLGMRFVPVTTNARVLAMPRVGATAIEGPLWATVERLVPAFREIVVARPPSGLDPYPILARDARVVGSIVVCDEDDAPPNCGRCKGCIVARARLASVGATEPTGLFREPLTPDLVERCARDLELDELMRVVASFPEGAESATVWARALARCLTPPRVHAPWPDVLAARVARAANRTGARLTDDVSFGWRPGDVPLRPEGHRRHDLVRAVVERTPRPVAWAMVDSFDDASGAAWCASRLRSGWGPGLVWGYGADGAIDGDTLARTLRAVATRVWWVAEGGLDAARVLETIEHGCLPVQAMPEVVAESTRAALPERLQPLVLSMAAEAPTPLSDPEVVRRLQSAVAELVAGSLERDLTRAATPVGTVG